MADTRVTLSGWTLDNPVIPASGTFGYGREFANLYDINVLGSFAIKGTTLNARFGNASPRVAECPAGMLNSVGLQNPGMAHVIEHELKAMDAFFKKPIVANVSGFSLDEYAECCRMLRGNARVGIIEVNISCPNVAHGGLSFGADPDCAREVARAAKAAADKPIYMKLSPNVADIAEIARACAEGGADGLSLINTLVGMRIDLKTRRPVLANRVGGLSGPAVLPVALRMVREVRRATGLPVIGMGGVSSARDVIEMLMAGATAVGVGAANLVNPFACRDIIDELPREMARWGIESLEEIAGGVC